jgi:hypothetical protein
VGLYNFQARFVPFILAESKTHTIRAMRVYPDKPGNILHLYTGLRTKKAKLLMRVPCVKVETIDIQFRVDSGYHEHVEWPSIKVDDEELSADEREQLARRDGFQNFAEMMEFWRAPKNRLPFRGHIIHWKAS